MRVPLRNIAGHGLALIALAWTVTAGHAEPTRPLKTVNAWAQYTDRIIVRLKDEPATEKRQAMSADRARTLSTAAGTILIPHRPTGGHAQVMRLTHAMPLAEVERITAKLAQDPSVLYAEPDRRKFPHATASDPRFNLQWNLFEAAGGINASTAWDVTTGSSSLVVAIVDTGILKTNPDMVGRFLPGYDFIGSDDGSPNNITRDPDTGSQFSTANDGSGRDTDSSDPGDWIDQTDKNGFFTDPSCTIADSSWHGTFVSSIYGAAANNNFGIAGVDWNARILPVRVLGKCGGYTSDIMDGARWAAGIQVMGAGNQLISSPNPAQVINLSLGGPGACSNFEQTAINDILAAGGVKAIVTSAGNGDASGAGEDAGNNSPGNCNGVINVAATDRAGSLTGYSDFGATIAISAPGGFIAQGSNGQDGLISTANCGITNPITTVGGCPTSTDNQLTGAPYIAFFVTGTSFAAPQVSGAISLMLSVNPTLSAAQVTSLLKSTARAFPAASNCSSTLLNKCGAGILNVNAAVRSAAAMPGGSNPSPPASGGRGGGGGGCTLGDGPADWLLPLLVLVSLLGLTRGRQKQN